MVEPVRALNRYLNRVLNLVKSPSFRSLRQGRSRVSPTQRAVKACLQRLGTHLSVRRQRHGADEIRFGR